MLEKEDFPIHRILVVDDETDVSLTMKLLLEICGQVVRVADDGPAALALVRSFAPDVVLLDLAMPEMDGLAVARQIRAMADIEQPTIVAVTGHGQLGYRRATLAAGFDHHLVKPVTFNRLTGLLFHPELHAAQEAGAFKLQRGPPRS